MAHYSVPDIGLADDGDIDIDSPHDMPKGTASLPAVEADTYPATSANDASLGGEQSKPSSGQGQTGEQKGVRTGVDGCLIVI